MLQLIILLKKIIEQNKTMFVKCLMNEYGKEIELNNRQNIPPLI